MRVLDGILGSVVGSIFTLVPAVLLGVWAARRRLLDEPQPHRRFLQRVAVLGVALAAAVGFGERAGLVAIRVQQHDRTGPVIGALAACGQRSMTCYLLRLMVLVAVLLRLTYRTSGPVAVR